MHSSSFQLPLSRWEQEMRSSDKDCMCWVLCHKFIWMLSCCVYAWNQPSSHFRSTICFMFGISIAFGLSPVAVGVECHFFYRVWFAFVYFFAAIRCFNFLSPKKLFLFLVLSCLIHAAVLQMLSLLFRGKKGFSLALWYKGSEIKLLNSLLLCVRAGSGKTSVSTSAAGCPGVTALRFGLIPKALTRGYSKFLWLPQLLVGDGTTGVHLC